MITTRDEVKLIIALLLSRDSVLQTGMMLIEKKRLLLMDQVDVVDLASTVDGGDVHNQRRTIYCTDYSGQGRSWHDRL